MGSRNRALLALLALCSAIAAGCSGGKSGSTPPTSAPIPRASQTPIAGASPTASGPATTAPSPAASSSSTPFVLRTSTPVPAATSVPSGNPITVNSRATANGDAFSYVGTTSQTFVYAGTTPNPSASSVASVRQTVNVTANKTYAGTAGLTQFTTNETDSSPRQATTLVTNTYYGTTTGPTNPTTFALQNALTTYGYTASDSSGQSIAVTIASPGYNNNSGTVDLLPEQRSPTWTNGTAETIVQNESDGFAATRTYAANGSYVESDTYPQGTAASAQPAALTAKIVENADGSGSYTLPLFTASNSTITFAAPTAAGLISIAFTDAQGKPVYSTMTSAWFAQPIALYTELDRDNGAVAFPAACNVPGTYGTQGNQVEQKYVRTDTVLGTLEFFDQLTYVAANGVAACVSLSDVTYVYYDYSGQTNTDAGIGFGGGNTPYETQTIATTLGIGSSTLASIGRRAPSDVWAGASAARVVNARANFLTTVDHYRLQRERSLVTHYRNAFARLRR